MPGGIAKQGFMNFSKKEGRKPYWTSLCIPENGCHNKSCCDNPALSQTMDGEGNAKAAFR